MSMQAGHDPSIADRINHSINYTMWSAFRLPEPLAADSVPARLAAQVGETLGGIEGLTVRGWYDISGFRADADLLVWWWAPEVEAVQAAYREFRRSGLGEWLEPTWSSIGIHRQAEFNARHVPAFLAGEPAGDYLCLYPFVRSYEWYLLPEEERRTMLRDHGLAAKDYGDVRANTVSTFALSDYEWLLAFEAQELHRIVDLMRDLRNTQARLHVRKEIPFFTGPRVELADWVETHRGLA